MYPPVYFSVVVECIGYSPFTIDKVTITQKHQVIDLKIIILRKKQQSLQNVNRYRRKQSWLE
jgi:hypothetical protein